MVIAEFIREHFRDSLMSDIVAMMTRRGLTMTPHGRTSLRKMTVGDLSEFLRRLSEASTYSEAEQLIESVEAAEFRGFSRSNYADRATD